MHRRRRAAWAVAVSLGSAAVIAAGPGSAAAQHVLYRSPAFTVTDSSVRQGRFEAVALSRDTIVSNYPRAAREVHFRFSLDGVDDEFAPGTEHVINVRPREGRIITPAYAFGVADAPRVPTPEESAGGEDGVASIAFRVDLRQVLRSIRDSGGYSPPNGPRLSSPPGHVYVVGDVTPLSWSTDSLRPGARVELSDADGDGIWSVTLPIASEYTRPLAADGRGIWARQRDISAFPALTSPQVLLDALYRMSLEELTQLVRSDGALSAGAKWPGVWTRDVSFSTVLALALIVPDAVRASLMAKVDADGRIIQDTGTGGSWPVSTDRMTWAMAAWELYAATGNRGWLRQAYDIISRSALADLHAARDGRTGLFRGESSFLDWREQSYPRWMDPGDIYMSEALGTNAVHHAAYRILADMARALGEPPGGWSAVADTVRRAMNEHLWQPDRGWYGQYRYGRNYPSLSPRAEGLGEALATITGVATPAQRETLMQRAPVVAFGTPTFWPAIPNERLYHNGTIWPFVTAYWTWAAADAGSTSAVEHGLASLERAAALFLTNKENMVAATGHFEGTALNSDRQLWSVAGMLATTYRVLFGLRLHPDHLELRPMVPPAYAGERTLSGLRYRGATLTITLRGFGSAPLHVRLDGRLLSQARIPATLTGAHRVDVEMNGHWPVTTQHLVPSAVAPAVPQAGLRGDTLEWLAVPGAREYVVYRNGRPWTRSTRTAVRAEKAQGLTEYQVLAEDSAGFQSFLGEPQRVVSASDVIVVNPPGALETGHSGFTGCGYLTLSLQRNRSVEFTVRVPRAGMYSVDLRYANGSGPINSDSKAALRTLFVDGREAGVIVMPQRGADRWSDWGYSSALQVALSAGFHRLRIAYTPLDENMDRRVNTALLDHVRLTRLATQ